ncbi:unnamed protein product [Durusdinium trenchii]|uniref:Pentatricopeptide repeat-containing protein, chloroplastic n=1 Tax=Durusdinium trenchii TaxID=1381693 RepID=A0ABP0MNM0_9DINO
MRRTNDGCATNFGTPGSRTRLCRSARFAAAVDKVSLLRLLQNPATPTGSLPHLVSETLAEELRGAKEVTVLLASFARRSLWRAAAALLLKADAVVDVPALGAAVRAFEKSGHWQLALALIEEFSGICSRRLRPDGGVFGSVFLACGAASQWRTACEMLEQLLRRKDEALQAWPVVEWQRVGTAALTACGRSREWRRGSQLLQMLQQKGLELSAVPFNAAMRYRNGKLGWEGNLVAIEELKSDHMTLNTLVQSCGERLAWQAAISVVKAASPWLDVSPDSMSFNTAISACARAHEWQQSFALLFEMEALRISPTVVSFNAAITAAADWEVALQLLQMIQSRRLAPDLLSFNSAMSSCRLAWTVVLQLLKTLQTEGLRPDVVSFNAALAAVASSGELRDWERALALLDTLHASGNAPDLISFNTAVESCGGAKRWDVALGHVEELLKAGLEPDLNTATAVARVCGHAGEWQRVFAFWQMTSVEPDGKLYGTLFLACEKGLQWQLAVQLFEEMRHSNALDSFTSPLVAPQAIRACATQNSWDLALWVLAECSQHGDPGPSAFLAAVDAVEAAGGASVELFEELCRRAAQSSIFA